MITEFILSALFGIVFALLDLLALIPISLPQGAINAITTVFNMIQGVGYFLPLDTFAVVISGIFIFYNIKVVADFISWILRKFALG